MPQENHSAGSASLPCCLCNSNESEPYLGLGCRFQSVDYSLRKCAKCGVVRVEPLPDPAAMQNLYTDKYYEDNYLAYEKERAAQFQRFLSRLERKGVGGSLLDIGCGAGILMRVAEKNGWRVEGVEPSAAARRAAERHYGFGQIKHSMDDLDRAGQFDAVVLWMVAAHCRDPVEMLRRSCERLKSGGCLVMTFINWNDPQAWLGFLQAKLLGWNSMHIPTIIWRFRKEHLVRMAEAAGLEVREIRYEPPAIRLRYGWKGTILQFGMDLWRALSRTNREIHVWCHKP